MASDKNTISKTNGQEEGRDDGNSLVDGRVGRGADAGDKLLGLGQASNLCPTVHVQATPGDGSHYNMSHALRGKCLIINNHKFEPHLKLNERHGTRLDGRSLYNCFQRLGFELELLPDAKASEIKDSIKSLSEQDFTHCDCLVICVMTHGELGSLYAMDQKYFVGELFYPFTAEKCPTLAGKPKIFFLQACHGDKTDPGVKVMSARDVPDNGKKPEPVGFYWDPTLEDFLIVSSTVPGFYSWRNCDYGSWFVQSLTKVLEEYGQTLDLLSCLTIVNREVAYKFESCRPGDNKFHEKKQSPSITSMLTRKVTFIPKITRLETQV
jgi:caspase-like apoptosis-related cysteine protease